MPTLARAKVVQAHMGQAYAIYHDEVYLCFRVIHSQSDSLNRYADTLILVRFV